MAEKTLGFIGVGRMGGPMARRLIDAGYALVVFDSNAEAVKKLTARGAKSAGSAAEVASGTEIVLMSLPTPDIVRGVALGERGVAQGNSVRTLIDLSTTGQGMASAIAGGLKERKIGWVDAPVSGGVAGAEKGTLAVMVSCPKETYAAVEPILKNFGRTFFAGEKPGLAQTAKLANNLLSVAALAATSEAVAMGVKAGLDAKVLVDIFNAGTGRNSATQDKFPKSILPRSFDFGFATGLAYKDIGLCMAEAKALGVPMTLGAAVHALLQATQDKYGAASDFTSLARVVEERAGVEIRG